MPGLYVHVPFCLQKCAYCAFYSVPLADVHGVGTVKDYFEGLAAEIRLRQQDTPLGVSSLFIGGGTPTALAPEGLERLLKMLVFTFEDIEATSEANPGTITPEKLRILRQYGIHRISLGAQSFSDQLLRESGRIHNAEAIREAVRLIRLGGFSNLNLDLMFGLPGQDMKTWQESIEEALRLGPEHLSLYALSLEAGTPLAKRYPLGQGKTSSRMPHLPDDDEQADMYEWAVECLVRAGYIHYEVSNFALPGKKCRHNLEIWRGRDYLGLGPGAVSTLGGVRWRNLENVAVYGQCLRNGELPLTEVEHLSERERMTERLMLGLRLSEGVSLEGFKQEFGQDLRDIYKDVLETYLQQKLLSIEENHLRLNPQYIFTANAILQAFG
ncbi:MAG: radical SAM family heme chaperone HemW [Desulfitobacteriaceae bacterium]|nr:radical SAM family heme chaperone HemW [Desulfitobacteriaceae bacterium]MDI6878627.1 radical SAM family heme chaperone HemW [Desulfitobacteriaceae bacterium]MDI6914896.1 radical SAM family heme chaperone HemW [Desulfitobacteriaceae bacterium]